VLEDLTVVAMQYQEELSEMQNNASIRTLFNVKRTMIRFCGETEKKYPNSNSFARIILLPFPLSNLVGCGFGAICVCY
jgi:hypothetical protein